MVIIYSYSYSDPDSYLHVLLYSIRKVIGCKLQLILILIAN